MTLYEGTTGMTYRISSFHHRDSDMFSQEFTECIRPGNSVRILAKTENSRLVIVKGQEFYIAKSICDEIIVRDYKDSIISVE